MNSESIEAGVIRIAPIVKDFDCDTGKLLQSRWSTARSFFRRASSGYIAVVVVLVIFCVLVFADFDAIHCLYFKGLDTRPLPVISETRNFDILIDVKAYWAIFGVSAWRVANDSDVFRSGIGRAIADDAIRDVVQGHCTYFHWIFQSQCDPTPVSFHRPARTRKSVRIKNSFRRKRCRSSERLEMIKQYLQVNFVNVISNLTSKDQKGLPPYGIKRREEQRSIPPNLLATIAPNPVG